jgi:hypothetical protein
MGLASTIPEPIRTTIKRTTTKHAGVLACAEVLPATTENLRGYAPQGR